MSPIWLPVQTMPYLAGTPLGLIKVTTQRLITTLSITTLAITVLSIMALATPAKANVSCAAALDQLQTHRTVAGETLANVAATYRLLPSTVIRFNPSLGSDLAPDVPLSSGTVLTIPPFNGLVVSVSSGESWQSLAERYGSRADLLFEVNGCISEVPDRIFIPGGITPVASRVSNPQLSGYPLSTPTEITTSYGWQPHPTRSELVFNSGIAFTILSVNDVLAVEDGIVAFAGERAGYGPMVVVNHAEGLQTRYVNLSDISVAVGQPVTASTPLGSVGGESPTVMYFEVRTNSVAGWVAEDPGKYVPALELR